MKRTGGVRIGWYHASWPLATLTANSNELRLKVFLADEYIFTKEQIYGIEPVGSIPILSQGIQIKHIVKEYPEKIIFYGGNIEKLIKEIGGAGFRPMATAAAAPQREGFPVRWQAIIAIIAIWNIPFFIDGGFKRGADPSKIGLMPLLALIAFFLGSIVLLRSKYMQSIILKPGRNVGEIKHVVSLVTLITGLLAFVFGLMQIFDKS